MNSGYCTNLRALHKPQQYLGTCLVGTLCPLPVHTLGSRLGTTDALKGSEAWFGNVRAGSGVEGNGSRKAQAPPARPGRPVGDHLPSLPEGRLRIQPRAAPPGGLRAGGRGAVSGRRLPAGGTARPRSQARAEARRPSRRPLPPPPPPLPPLWG